MESGKKSGRLKDNLLPALSIVVFSGIMSCAGMPSAVPASRERDAEGKSVPSLPAPEAADGSSVDVVEKSAVTPEKKNRQAPDKPAGPPEIPDQAGAGPEIPPSTVPAPEIGDPVTVPSPREDSPASPSGGIPPPLNAGSGTIPPSAPSSTEAPGTGAVPRSGPLSAVPYSSGDSRKTEGGASGREETPPPPDAAKIPELPLIASAALKSAVSTSKPAPGDRAGTRKTVEPVPKPDFHQVGPLVRPEPDTGIFRIGKSGQGRDLTVRAFRNSRPTPSALFISAGIHGKYESTTVELAEAFSRYFSEHHSLVDIYVLENMNPDSFFTEVRMGDDTPNGYRNGVKVGRAWYRFTSGYVDLNRNFATSNWKTDAWYNANDLRLKAGGPKPFSEPESRFLAESLSELRTKYSAGLFVVNYHSYTLSAGSTGVVQPAYTGTSSDPSVRDSDLRLAELYAKASGYKVLPAWTQYEITGELLNWCGEQGIPAVDVELANPDPVHAPNADGSSHYYRNLKAVLSLIEQISGKKADPFSRP